MGDGTIIEWSDATWNPLVGCKAVSPGCDHCYAARESSGRLRNVPAYKAIAAGGVFTGEVRLLPDRLDQPLRWRKPRRIFVNSMSDLFHPDVPDDFILRVFSVMAQAERHTFQVLTKRPQRMASFCQRLCWTWPGGIIRNTEKPSVAYLSPRDPSGAHEEPLPNVWLGTSIESQQYAFRARHLLDTPAAVRFISAEPLLGPLNLGPYLSDWDPDLEDGLRVCQAHGVVACTQEPGCMGIDWVIVGGESGPGARPMHPGWARDLRDQCQAAGVPFLFKQFGEWVEAKPGPGTVWRTGDGIYEPRPWEPDSAGAAPGRWDRHGDVTMHRVGKRAAGRSLDGRTWDEYPG